MSSWEERRGWFADIEPDPDDPDAGYSPDFPWQAVIQVGGACHALGGVWFQSKADCETFIRDEIIGKGWIPPLGGDRDGNPSEIPAWPPQPKQVPPLSARTTRADTTTRRRAMSNDTETATSDDRLADVLAAVRNLAGGYEKLREIPSGPEIASDIRVLLEVADGAVGESDATVRARRRAAYVIEHVACPKCGREVGQPCASLNAALGDAPRPDRTFPHPERDKADTERRRTIGEDRP